MKTPVMSALLLLLSGSIAVAAPQVEKNYGDNPDAPLDERFSRAAQAHKDGELDEAFKIYDEILGERPNDVPTIITYGNMLWKTGQLDAAEQRFRQALSIEPAHIKAHQWLGQLLFHRGQRKASREVFEGMHKLKFMREDVIHSANLNLGKIALIEEDWRKVRRIFRRLRADGNKADRKSSERGLARMKDMMAAVNWSRADGKRLMVHFSPEVLKTKDKASRAAYVQKLDQWVDSAVATLGMKMPERWHLYVFGDDVDCGFVTGRSTAHDWDYSWWLSHTAEASRYDPRHTLAVQLVARVGGSRPMSRCLVEGFCAWLAGVPKDAHGYARKLLKSGSLPSIIQLHLAQRKQPQYEAGMSLVQYLLDTYGIEKFMVMWRRFNVTVTKARYKIGHTRSIKWQGAFDELFQNAFGADLATIEGAWRGSLRRD